MSSQFSGSARVEQAIRALPDSPGIYMFRGDGGEALYVGKAKSLRKRGASYLRPQNELRLRSMLEEASDLGFLVTDTEAEALALENNWIKTRQPRFNIRLRDDKTYPYLKLTAGPYPRLAFTRRIRKDGAQYFGPYLPAGLARKAIKIVQKLFGVRVCRIPIDGSLPRPCLYYDMNRCLGPCVAGLTDDEGYLRAVEDAALFLAGRNDALLRELKGRMKASAETLDYEDAARLRDLIAEVREIGQRRKMSSIRGDDVDVYGTCILGDQAAILVLVMRGGQVLDRREIFLEGHGGVELANLLSEIVPQIYDRTTFIPKEIHVPAPLDGEDALVEWLSAKKGERVYVRMPARGPKAQRLQLATHNAELAFARRFRSGRGNAKGEQAAARLADLVGLARPPERIDGFDISTFQGASTVASMVVWEDGSMNKREYRSFNIRGLDRPDDFESLRQAVERRYRRVLDEVGAMPDLILIDGGRGQLNSAIRALALLGVEETPIVALAKKNEEIYIADRPEPLVLPRTDPALKALQEIRDEAHRFAVDRHRRRRRRGTLTSRLRGLRGVGPRRTRYLLRTFGSIAGVNAATLEELQGAVGERIGRSIHEQLHERATNK